MADEAGVVETTAGASDLQNRRLVQPLNQTILLDYQGGTLVKHVAWASPGTATSAAKWRVCELTYDGNSNVTSVKWAGGTLAYAFKYDDAVNNLLTYS